MTLDWGLYANFTPDEFRCKCGCGEVLMDPRFMARLQHLRSAYKRPMKITSGYRCAKHPVEAKKPMPGVHSQGIAADIGVRGSEAFALLEMAFKFGFTGIGINQKGDSRFIHLDISTDDNRPTIWSY